MLFLRIVAEHVPPMCNLRRVSPPHLGEDDGPEAHEEGEHHRGPVVKEVLGPGHHAGRLQRPELTELITDRAHGHVGHGAYKCQGSGARR